MTDPWDAISAYFVLTARTPSPGALAYLNRLSDTYGDEATAKALAQAHQDDSDPSRLLSRAEVRLQSQAKGIAAERRRKAALEESEKQLAQRQEWERKMPPEKMAENLDRLRAEMVRLGLIDSKEAA